MQTDKTKYWFPAKRYGWGWGLPNCWQGWVVYGVWAACLAAGAALLVKDHLGIFIGYTMVLTAIFIIIVVRKGEPPRWRWGGD
jgi:hypothetical protein